MGRCFSACQRIWKNLLCCRNPTIFHGFLCPSCRSQCGTPRFCIFLPGLELLRSRSKVRTAGESSLCSNSCDFEFKRTTKLTYLMTAYLKHQTTALLPTMHRFIRANSFLYTTRCIVFSINRLRYLNYYRIFSKRRLGFYLFLRDNWWGVYSRAVII